MMRGNSIIIDCYCLLEGEERKENVKLQYKKLWYNK